MAHPSSERFYSLLDSVRAMHDAKQEDYGTDTDPFANVRSTEEFGVQSWLGAVIRMNDKMTRLKSFALKGKVKNESVEDSLLDIAVYALIALVLFEEKVAEEDARWKEFEEFYHSLGLDLVVE